MLDHRFRAVTENRPRYLVPRTVAMSHVNKKNKGAMERKKKVAKS